ncbi:hypothetical protein PPYR_12455 [Photinus pyralis]|uniref:DUF19 domain-containing protein n=1 Tax=Photinus pyralis TaxID=7054 RepID=A0A5N4AE72_PHOPY|nr:uncharacterized protein LOC116176582 [Photinus pyralis]KAB0795616.1 hypothetical protein PPYR_12455 [Photinus pyralis]
MQSLTLIFLFLGGVVCNVKCEKKGVTLQASLDDLLENKCKKAGIDDHVTGFYETLLPTLECLDKQNVSKTSAMDPTLTDVFCQGLNKNVRECFKTVIDNVEKCLDDDEKYLPNLIFEAIDNFLDLICEEKFIESLNELSFKQCKKNISKNNALDVCFENFIMKLLISGDVVVFKKAELCSGIQDFYDCYEGVIKVICPNDDKIMLTLLNKFHKAIFSACHKEEKSHE